MLPTRFEYTFEATVRYDTDYQQWYPGVKIFLNDNFQTWQEFQLGFDEERFAMPYARMFRDELMEQYRGWSSGELKLLG